MKFSTWAPQEGQNFLYWALVELSTFKQTKYFANSLHSIKQLPCRARENHRAFWWQCEGWKVTWDSVIYFNCKSAVPYTDNIYSARASSKENLDTTGMCFSWCMRPSLSLFPFRSVCAQLFPMGINKLLSPCFVSWASVEILVCALFWKPYMCLNR